MDKECRKELPPPIIGSQKESPAKSVRFEDQYEERKESTNKKSSM